MAVRTPARLRTPWDRPAILTSLWGFRSERRDVMGSVGVPHAGDLDQEAERGDREG
jgi:hypothetical protein